MSSTKSSSLFLQAVFLSATVPHDPKRSSRVWRVARRQLLSLWRSRPALARDYLSRLLDSEEKMASLCLLSLLAEHCSQTGGLDSSQQVWCLSLFNTHPRFCFSPLFPLRSPPPLHVFAFTLLVISRRHCSTTIVRLFL